MRETKYLIIGAGLSGLTTAYKLLEAGEKDFLVIESRNRLGGRIHTHSKIDLGATWFQNYHEEVSQLLNELGIKKYPQYSLGRSLLVYNSIAPAHYFQNDQSAYRIAGGSIAMIENLFSRFRGNVHLNTAVSKIESKGNHAIVTTNQGVYKTENVVITIPPRLANEILFIPELPENLRIIMENTHTWMSKAIKVGLIFKTPFRRKKKLSGMLIGQTGHVMELYDHTNFEENTFALMGFVNEALRDLPEQERKLKVLDYLRNYFGAEIFSLLSYFEKDWSKDPNTASHESKNNNMRPQYGDLCFDTFYLDGKVLFSGAETSIKHGGYMDGAIFTGKRAVHKLFNDR